MRLVDYGPRVGRITVQGLSSYVNLPAGIMRALGWKKGDMIVLEVREDHLEVRKVDMDKVLGKRGENGESNSE